MATATKIREAGSIAGNAMTCIVLATAHNPTIAAQPTARLVQGFCRMYNCVPRKKLTPDRARKAGLEAFRKTVEGNQCDSAAGKRCKAYSIQATAQ